MTYAPLSDLLKSITHGNGLVTSAAYGQHGLAGYCSRKDHKNNVL